jgi:hypothetical protein
MTRVSWVFGVCVLAPQLMGCDEDHAGVELIEKTRVLTARVEVAGEPSRASPLPGETVSVRFLVVAPEPEPTFAFSLASCVAIDSASTVPECSGEPIARGASLEPLAALPSLEFVTPAELIGTEWLAVTGVICPAGGTLNGETTDACSNGRGQAVSVDFPLDDGNAPNSNPTLLNVGLDGAELSADTASSEDCSALPQIKAGSKQHPLRVEVDPSSRDPLPVIESSDASRESLLVSYFITGGILEHAWGSLPSTAASNAVATRWEAPATSAPLIARIIIVVRDGRGGSDFTERRVCVIP